MAGVTLEVSVRMIGSARMGIAGEVHFAQRDVANGPFGTLPMSRKDIAFALRSVADDLDGQETA